MKNLKTEITENNTPRIEGKFIDFLVSVCFVGWVIISLPEYPLLAFIGGYLQICSYFVMKLFSIQRFQENIASEPSWVKILWKINMLFVYISQKYLWRIVKFMPIPLIIASCWLLPEKQRYISWLVIAYFYTCVGGAVIFYEEDAKNEKGRSGICKSNKKKEGKLCLRTSKHRFL